MRRGTPRGSVLASNEIAYGEGVPVPLYQERTAAGDLYGNGRAAQPAILTHTHIHTHTRTHTHTYYNYEKSVPSSVNLLYFYSLSFFFSQGVFSSEFPPLSHKYIYLLVAHKISVTFIYQPFTFLRSPNDLRSSRAEYTLQKIY